MNIMKPPNWIVDDNCLGRLLSVSAIGLAILARSFNYSTTVVWGCMVQYVLSTLVWTPPVHPIVQWGDRSVSIINMIVLSREYYARGASYMYMSLLLSYTVGYKIMDNKTRVKNELTWYYVGWHCNLVFLNYCIMWYCHHYGTDATPHPLSMYQWSMYISGGLSIMRILNCNSMFISS